MTMKKTLKSPRQNREEMARHGAPRISSHLGTLKIDLKALRARYFGKNPQNDVLLAISEVFHKISLKCAKSPFNVLKIVGLKNFFQNRKKSVTSQSHFFEKGGFCHV
jgi:hypothetical protein